MMDSAKGYLATKNYAKFGDLARLAIKFGAKNLLWVGQVPKL